MARSNRWPLAITCLVIGASVGLVANPKLVGQPALAPPEAQPLPRDWNSYAQVVKQVLPAVVSIEGQGRPRPKADEADPGFGSGFLIDPAGVVVTNHHVVRGISVVEVTLHDGRKFMSQDIRRDPQADLAVIRLVSKDQLPFLEFGDSDAMEVGDRVLAIGAPFGLIGSVTQGIVSGKSRSVNIYLYEDFLQTDAAVNPGNSGGPIVSMDGKVIGLAAAIKTRSGGSQGVGLAVSSKLAKVVVDQLVKNGVVRRPYIGVSVVDLDPSTATKLKLKPGSGVLVTEVVAKSPGERGNIGIHDVITKVNGITVKTSREMHRALLWAPIGQPIEIAVTREGKSFVTKVAVEEQPDVVVSDQPNPPRQDRVKFDSIGVAVGDLTAEAASREGLPKGLKGVIVSGVTKGSLAEQSGLTRGLIVVQVNKQPVASPAAFRESIEQSTREKGAVLRVLRAGGELDFVILKLQ